MIHSLRLLLLLSLPAFAGEVSLAEDEALAHLQQEGILDHASPALEAGDVSSAQTEALSRVGSQVLRTPGVTGIELGEDPHGKPSAFWVFVCPGFGPEAEDRVHRLFDGLGVYFIRTPAKRSQGFRDWYVSPLVEERTAAKCPDVLLDYLPPPDSPIERFVQRGLVEDSLAEANPTGIDPGRLYEYAKALMLTRHRREAIWKVVDAKVALDDRRRIVLRVYTSRDWLPEDESALRALYPALDLEIIRTDHDGSRIMLMGG